MYLVLDGHSSLMNCGEWAGRPPCRIRFVIPVVMSPLPGDLEDMEGER
jgi:hypothetical protein